MNSKTSLLVISEILRLLANRLTVDDRFSLLKRNNLRQPIQFQLSKKRKIFSEFFAAHLKSR